MNLFLIGTGLLSALQLSRNCLAIDVNEPMLEHVNGRFNRLSSRKKDVEKEQGSDEEISSADEEDEKQDDVPPGDGEQSNDDERKDSDGEQSNNGDHASDKLLVQDTDGEQA